MNTEKRKTALERRPRTLHRGSKQSTNPGSHILGLEHLDHVGEETNGSNGGSIAVTGRDGGGGGIGSGARAGRSLGGLGGTAGVGVGGSARRSSSGRGRGGSSKLGLGVDGAALGPDRIGAVRLATSVAHVGSDAVLEGPNADEGGQSLVVVLEAGGSAVFAGASVGEGVLKCGVSTTEHPADNSGIVAYGRQASHM